MTPSASIDDLRSEITSIDLRLSKIRSAREAGEPLEVQRPLRDQLLERKHAVQQALRELRAQSVPTYPAAYAEFFADRDGKPAPRGGLVRELTRIVARLLGDAQNTLTHEEQGTMRRALVLA